MTYFEPQPNTPGKDRPKKAKTARRASCDLGHVSEFQEDLPEWLLFFIRGVLLHVFHQRDMGAGRESVIAIEPSAQMAENLEDQFRKAKAFVRLNQEIERCGMSGPRRGTAGFSEDYLIAAELMSAAYSDACCPAAPRVVCRDVRGKGLVAATRYFLEICIGVLSVINEVFGLCFARPPPDFGVEEATELSPSNFSLGRSPRKAKLCCGMRGYQCG